MGRDGKRPCGGARGGGFTAATFTLIYNHAATKKEGTTKSTINNPRRWEM